MARALTIVMRPSSIFDVRSVQRLTAIGIAVALLSVFGGCARLDRTSPSAMVGMPAATPTGVWRGTISGHEMSDAGGPVTASMELTLTPDGTFALADASGARATGQARWVRRTLVLDGQFVSPASRAGEPVMERLQLGRGHALYGTVETLFRGLKVTGGADLAKAM